MSAIAHVAGARRDLTRVPGAPDVRRLTVEGPGVQGLEGLERFTALQALHLRRVPADALRALTAMRGLVELRLDEPSGPVDWATVAALSRLETLVADLVERRQAEALAQVALGGLGALRTLELRLLGDAAPVRLGPCMVADATSLSYVEANNFILDAGDLERLCRRQAALELVHYTLDPDDPEAPELRRRLPQAVDVVALGGHRPEPDVGVVRAAPGSEGRRHWLLRLAIEGVGDESTTLDVHTAVERARAIPGAAERLEIEVDDDDVWLSSEDRDALEAARNAFGRRLLLDLDARHA